MKSSIIHNNRRWRKPKCPSTDERINKCGVYTQGNFFLNKFNYLYLFLFLAVLGLRCYARAFSSCGEQGLLFVAVCGLLIVVASLVAEHGL